MMMHLYGAGHLDAMWPSSSAKCCPGVFYSLGLAPIISFLCVPRPLVMDQGCASVPLSPASAAHSLVGQFCEMPFIYLFIYLGLSRAACAAYGGSQAKGRSRATAASLRHSHSNMESEPRLQPTP